MSSGIILLVPCGSSNSSESGERRSSNNSGTLNSHTSDNYSYNSNSNNNNNNDNNSGSNNNNDDNDNVDNYSKSNNNNKDTPFNNISDTYPSSFKRPSYTAFRNNSQTSMNPFDNDDNTYTSLQDHPQGRKGSILQLKIDKIQCKAGDFLDVDGDLFSNKNGNLKEMKEKSYREQNTKDNGIFGKNLQKQNIKGKGKDIDMAMEMEERGREMEREKERNKIRGKPLRDFEFGLKKDQPGVPRMSDGLVYGSGTGTGFGYDKDRPRERPSGVTHIERFAFNTTLATSLV